MFQSKSLLKNSWILQNVDERSILSLSQKKNISYLLSKLLILRGITLDSVEDYLQSNILDNYPNPFNLIDMEKAINRVIEGIKNNQKFGIIADYDVDGSTSAAILYKFLSNFTKNISLKIPNRLTEGYGPNIRIMDEMLNDNIKIVFTLDCGTTAFNIIDNIKYNEIDVIVIDHHLSETKLPKVHSIINPNRVDENNNFNQMAAVGVTFLFLMGLRKKLRNFNLTMSKTEPNLMSYLDLVALGTICDVVKLTDYNRRFVKKGLELIKQRHNKSISKIIDNSKINSAPSASDLGYIVGPQLNAASRIDDSSLPSKFLISNDINQIESISRKLFLLNEKRKLIENKIFEESLQDAEKQIKSKYILVHGKNWHNGVLGIVASRLISYFNKPVIVVSFINNFGIGSARSIDNIDLGQIILNAKHQKILIGGGGHSMAAGIKIKYEKLDKFILFLNQSLDNYDSSLFDKNSYYDSIISVNELNNNLLKTLQKMEPYGSGNAEPNFIIKDLIIESVKIIKEKHLLLFFENNNGDILKGICFNCINNPLGEYLLNFKKYKFNFGCSITVDNYSNQIQPQIIVKDVMITD